MSKKVITIVLVVIFGIGAVLVVPKALLFLAGRQTTINEKSMDFYFNANIGLEGLATKLYNEKFIDDKEALIKVGEYKNLNSNKLASGKYSISSGTNFRALLNGFTKNSAGNGNAEVEVEVTFNNCRDVYQLAGKVSKLIMVDSSSLVQEITSPKLLAEMHVTLETLPSIFLPNTYRMFYDTDASQFVNLMAKQYTSKIWKIDPAYISSDWANQRFQQVNVLKLIKLTVKKILKFDFSSYSLKDQALAPDGGEFWYPLNGIQDIPDTYANLIKTKEKEENCNCEIFTNAKLDKIDLKNKKVFYQKNNLLEYAKYNKAIISTIPIYSLYESLEEKNDEVTKSICDLKYMDIIFVYLMIDRDKISDDHWLYFSDKNIIFNRAVEFKNWSKKMAPKNQTSLCLDITCYRDDKSADNPWNYSKKDLSDRCIDDCVKVGLLDKKDVFDTLIIKVKDAYPFYDLHYKKRLEFIVSFLEKNKDIHCIGRTGLFSYNNSDGSIEMGINLAKNLSMNIKDSFLQYEFKKNSF